LSASEGEGTVVLNSLAFYEPRTKIAWGKMRATNGCERI